jgi:transposase
MGDWLVSRLEFIVEPKAPDLSRVEIITGTGRRRQFSESEKSRIVEQALAPGAVVSEIARSQGLTPQQLFTWRRAARRRLSMDSGKSEASFVPALVVKPSAQAQVAIEGRDDEARTSVSVRPHDIEHDIGDDSAWIWRGADVGLVTTVIRALKASKRLVQQARFG